ncbi:hypothetical protein TSUD_54730 [Trifolium subterraneum]|uniref:Disease resistance protein At4g27190-like leucine-rich repeats domain-containing protein n=1 Tax=Trifolium subterraneum TaxID=3900 RepID=A0A2Z6M947_TRISU|nr:hypothetical protein TSUD_54730 [Trifolium subterraneum]
MPHLELLKLSKINSRKLWDDKLPGLSYMQNLRRLTIDKCCNIAYAFSFSVAREFVNLKYLAISNCQMLEEIFVSDGKFGSLPLSQNQFSNNEVVPNTSELILNSKDVTMLCNGQLNDELIYTVTNLRLRCFHDESDKFPSDFLQRFVNLKKLKVTCSSFTYILNGSECDGHSETIMKLRILVLVELDNLEFICEENSEVQPILQNIETLSVHRCSRLKNIIQSSVLFENLEELLVVNCAGLENILKSSTAISLQKLRKLYIDGCEKIEEIVASDDDNDTSELVFMKLEYLWLKKLPSLRSFCKGRHGFKFPLLKSLFVIDCPVMETFSHGVLDAAKLKKGVYPHVLDPRLIPNGTTQQSVYNHHDILV